MSSDQSAVPSEGDDDVLRLFIDQSAKPTWHVCKNCMYAFQAKPITGASKTGQTTLPEVTVGCPRCGASVPVKVKPVETPEGYTIYSVGSDNTQIKNMIAEAVEQGLSANELADQIEAQVPALKQFAAWLRENPWFMALGAAVLAPLLTVLLTHWINAPAPPSKTEITRIIEEHTVTQTASPPPAPPTAP